MYGPSMSLPGLRMVSGSPEERRWFSAAFLQVRTEKRLRMEYGSLSERFFFKYGFECYFVWWNGGGGWWWWGGEQSLVHS